MVAWPGGGWAAFPAEGSVMFCSMETWSRMMSFAHHGHHLVKAAPLLALNGDAGQAGGDGDLDAVRAG
jgi:hypothetical protein